LSKKPSPALAVSAVALFAALGGTGLATTHGHDSAHKRKPKPAVLTPARVNKLIAAYLHAHPSPIGPQGPQGQAGGPGLTGPQGPGATRITGSQTGFRTPATIATVGPWQVLMSCGTGVSVNIIGPGNYYDTTVSGTSSGDVAAQAEVHNGSMSPAGVTASTASTSTQQTSQDVQLISGATMYEVRLQMTSTGVAGTCTVSGSAIAVN
jgi:hypothetical protein